MPTIPVAASRPYNIIVGQDLLQNCDTYLSPLLSARRIVVVSDDHVAPLYADRVIEALSKKYTVSLCVLAHGEESKSFETLLKLYDFFTAAALDRKDAVIALGGGVVGDVTGFAAATYLRGIDFIQMPTTLLAQIDSSIGGKTAVNTACGKNLIGSFYQPRLVLCDLSTLCTLPDDILSDGLAEAVKAAMIRDASLLSLLSDHPKENLEEIVCRCIHIKREIVEQDEKESGVRALLNFGHTFGHAIEKITHYDISHGRAVALGMIKVTERFCENANTVLPLLQKALLACNLPTECPYKEEDMLPYLVQDKKRDGDCIQFVVVNQIGDAVLLALSSKDWGPKIS